MEDHRRCVVSGLELRPSPACFEESGPRIRLVREGITHGHARGTPSAYRRGMRARDAKTLALWPAYARIAGRSSSRHVSRFRYIEVYAGLHYQPGPTLCLPVLRNCDLRVSK